MASKRPRSASPDEEELDEIVPLRGRAGSAAAAAAAAGGPAHSSDEEAAASAPARRKRRTSLASGRGGAGGGAGRSGRRSAVALTPEEEDDDVELELEEDDGDEDGYSDEGAGAADAGAAAGRPPRAPTSHTRAGATRADGGDDGGDDYDDDEGDEQGDDAGLDVADSDDAGLHSEADSGALAEQMASDALSARFGFAQVGILEKVRVENFMCHECFEFVFGPNINIINGQNGSGKSAIVAALQIGLGVKASKTERARKISDHIMHGKDWALISIRIRNLAGDDGDTGLCFRHDAYGDAVVVERKITKTATALTFKSARGHRVAPERSARAELDAILDTFNLQVDNPIAILTQQKSKQFLLSGKDGAMYDFFMEATLLSAAYEELETVRQVSGEIDEVLKQKRGLRPEIESQLQALEARYNEAKDMKSLADRLEDLHRRYAWATVAEYEEELEARTDEAEARRAKVVSLGKQLESRKAKTDAVQTDMLAANDAFDSASEVYSQLRSAASGVEQDVKAAKGELSRKQRDVEAAGRGVRDAEVAQRKAEGDKQRIIQRHLASSRDKEGLQARVDAARAEAEGARQRRDAAVEAKAVADQEWRRLDADRLALVRDRAAREAEYRAADGEYRGLSRSAESEVAKWGYWMPDLMTRIEAAHRQGRFHARPVGPMGSLISVLDRRWARAIQVCVGMGTLNTFLVLDSHDERVLRELGRALASGGGRSINLNIAIAGINKSRYAITSQHKPSVGYPTMLDMVSVSHNAAFNALVDFARIEQQVLVEDPTEHRRVGYTPSPNLAQAWTPDASRAYVASRAEIFRSDSSTAPVLLGADMASTIAAAKAALAEAHASLEGARNRFHAHETRMSEAKARVVAAKAELDTAVRQVAATERTQGQLEDALDQTTEALDTSANDTEIQRCKDEVTDATQRLSECQAAIGELEAAAEAAEARATAERTKIRAAMADKERAHAELKRLSVELSRSQSLRKALIQELTAEKEESEAHDKEVEAMNVDVAKQTEMAKSICADRVDTTGQTSKQLENEINAHKKRLSAEQQRRDNRTLEEIEAEFVSAQKRKATNDASLRAIKAYATGIRKSFVFRRAQLLKLTKFLMQLASFYFSSFMRTRGHKGELLFNKREHSLQFGVSMANHKNNEGGLHKTTDLRSLSGGERSYTTLSFMLALGESMVLPVRIMDEFDVFMDEANRHAAYKTLVDFAKKQLSDRQLIFITPLTLPAVQPGPAVKIQRLCPPSRAGGGGGARA